MSFGFLKTNSKFLEIGLQTFLPNFFRNQFLEGILKNQFFYKNSIDPNTILLE
jgi:hypothetical protein